MCALCLSFPCVMGCPNRPEPKSVNRCPRCEEGIQEGEQMVEVRGEYFHLDCLSDMSTKELLEFLGYEIETEVSPEDYRDEED